MNPLLAKPPTPPALSAEAHRFLPWLVAIGFFMQLLDSTIVNTALPSMARDLGESPLQMQSVVVVYLLTVALLIPASGWLADRFGTRRMFHVALLLFSLGALLCAASFSLTQLVLARMLQAAGGALLMPVGRLALLKVFPAHEMIRVLAFVTLPGLLGPLLGPVVGGWLVEVASWHWIFLVNLPIGVLGLVLTSRWMPNLFGERVRFDFRGFALFGGGLVLLTWALQSLGRKSAPLPLSLGLLAAGVVLLLLYGLHARRHARPLFSAELMKLAPFRLALWGNFFARLGMGAMPFLVPLFLQLALGFTPSHAGLTMIPLALGAMASKTLVERLIHRFGFRAVLSVNSLLLGALMAGLALVGPMSWYPGLLAYLCLLGIATSLQFTAMNSLTLLDLGDAHTSGGNTLFAVAVQVSMGMGVALAGTLLGLFGGLAPSVHPLALLGTFQLTFLSIGAACALAASVFIQVPAHKGVMPVAPSPAMGGS